MAVGSINAFVQAAPKPRPTPTSLFNSIIKPKKIPVTVPTVGTRKGESSIADQAPEQHLKTVPSNGNRKSAAPSVASMVPSRPGPPMTRPPMANGSADPGPSSRLPSAPKPQLSRLSATVTGAAVANSAARDRKGAGGSTARGQPVAPEAAKGAREHPDSELPPVTEINLGLSPTASPAGAGGPSLQPRFVSPKIARTVATMLAGPSLQPRFVSPKIARTVATMLAEERRPKLEEVIARRSHASAQEGDVKEEEEQDDEVVWHRSPVSKYFNSAALAAHNTGSDGGVGCSVDAFLPAQTSRGAWSHGDVDER